MPAEKKPMIWRGKKLNTMGEIFSAALSVRSKADGAVFLKTYMEWCHIDEPTALSNLGYFAGYYGEKERRFVADVFGAKHPIFGDNIGDVLKAEA